MAEGCRQKAAKIAVIADIAVIARDRKSKNLTTDKHGWHGSEIGPGN